MVLRRVWLPLVQIELQQVEFRHELRWSRTWPLMGVQINSSGVNGPSPPLPIQTREAQQRVRSRRRNRRNKRSNCTPSNSLISSLSHRYKLNLNLVVVRGLVTLCSSWLLICWWLLFFFCRRCSCCHDYDFGISCSCCLFVVVCFLFVLCLFVCLFVNLHLVR